MSRVFTAPAVPLMTFVVRADALWLDVTADAGVRSASVELTGPAPVLDDARAELSGSTWTLTLPRDPSGGATVTSGCGGAVIVGGTITGSVVMTGGRVFINGAEVRPGQHHMAPDVLRAVVRLPAGASLTARVGAGRVGARGVFAAVMAQTVSADLELTGSTGVLDAVSVSGDIDADGTGPARTTSGDITLAAACGAVTAQTTSGDIRVHVGAPVAVRADSVSGDIRVTADPDARPAVTARSVSGRVRTPRAGEAR